MLWNSDKIMFVVLKYFLLNRPVYIQGYPQRMRVQRRPETLWKRRFQG